MQPVRQARPGTLREGQAPAIPVPGPLPARAGEYLVFRLGGTDYAIDFHGVEEIRRGADMAPNLLPQPNVCGTVEVRGQATPVLDLRAMLAIAPHPDRDRRPVIIVDMGATALAMMADAIGYLLTLEDDDIHPAPAGAGAWGTLPVAGLGAVDARLLVLLDARGLLACAETSISNTRQ